MITLRNKATGEYIEVTYQQYGAMPNLLDYEPIDANHMVEVFKIEEGMMSSYLITDEETGEKIVSDQPDLYPDCDPFDTECLKIDYASRTMDTEEYQRWLEKRIEREG